MTQSFEDCDWLVVQEEKKRVILTIGSILSLYICVYTLFVYLFTMLLISYKIFDWLRMIKIVPLFPITLIAGMWMNTRPSLKENSAQVSIYSILLTHCHPHCKKILLV